MSICWFPFKVKSDPQIEENNFVVDYRSPLIRSRGWYERTCRSANSCCVMHPLLLFFLTPRCTRLVIIICPIRSLSSLRSSLPSLVCKFHEKKFIPSRRRSSGCNKWCKYLQYSIIISIIIMTMMFIMQREILWTWNPGQTRLHLKRLMQIIL